MSADGWRTTEKSAVGGEVYRCDDMPLLLNFKGYCMNKETALKTIVNCAKLYRDNLVNHKILFIFGGEDSIQYFEAICLPRHYKHLTGVVSPTIKSVDFYKMCLSGNLPPSAFTLNNDGTTKMKLSVLHQVMNIHKTAKMAGTYNTSKLELCTEKVTGTTIACMGFVRETANGSYYVPNTVLKEDLRNVVYNPAQRMLAIFRKPKNIDLYTECTYLAKNISLEFILKNEEIRRKIVIKK